MAAPSAPESWSARAAMVFQLNEKASAGIAPAGTAVVAPPPPGSNAQIVFETEQALSVMGGKLGATFTGINREALFGPDPDDTEAT